MFERFTDRARRVVVLAQEEARAMNHDYIGLEHLLLGLAAENEGIAAKTLGANGLSLITLRERVRELVPEGTDSPGGHVPFTPASKNVLERSLREALQLGHNYIGTEHILLAMARMESSTFGELTKYVTRSQIRETVIQLMGGYTAPVKIVSGWLVTIEWQVEGNLRRYTTFTTQDPGRFFIDTRIKSSDALALISAVSVELNTDEIDQLTRVAMQ